jgi:TolB protein
VNADGTGRRRLAPKSGSVPLWWPAWAPNGRTIAFVRNARLWEMKADGNAARQIGGGLRAATGPAWSPDGARLAFVTYDSNDAARLLVVKPHGTGGRTSGPGVQGLSGSGAALAWSPTVTRIAFVLHSRVTVMNPDGTGIKPITPPRAGYGIFGLDW